MHVSGRATAIGIGLGIAFDTCADAKVRITPATIARNTALLHYNYLSFGGVIGVLIYQAISGFLLILAAIILLAIALSGLRRARSP
jgi:hypothetical protein